MTKKKYRNLREIAEQILEDALRKDAVATNTPQMQRKYKLDDAQMLQVKKRVKAYAANQGVMWAYDPSIQGFRVCPEGTPRVAQGMIEYAYKNWHDQGVSINHLAKGARGQEFISKQMLRNTEARNDAARSAIREAGSRVKFLKPKN